MAGRKSLLKSVLDEWANAAQAREGRRLQAAHERRARKAERQRKSLERRQAAEANRRRKAMTAQERARLEQSVANCNSALMKLRRELNGVLLTRPRCALISPAILHSVFTGVGVEMFCLRLQEALETSAYPAGVPRNTPVVALRTEARELLLERELPRLDAVPRESEFRLVKGEVRTIVETDSAVGQLYGQLLARVALRTLAEAFAATPPSLVDSIVLNGWVAAVDKATGRPITPHLISVRMDRGAFAGLALDAPELDPEACLRAQHALISPHPHDLVPVKPLLDYDLNPFKTISGVDFLVDLDSGRDLLSLSATEFET